MITVCDHKCDHSVITKYFYWGCPYRGCGFCHCLWEMYIFIFQFKQSCHNILDGLDYSGFANIEHRSNAVQAYMFPVLDPLPVEYSPSIAYSLWLTTVSGCQPESFKGPSLHSQLASKVIFRNVSIVEMYFNHDSAGCGKVHDQGRFRKRCLFKRTLRLLIADINH